MNTATRKFVTPKQLDFIGTLIESVGNTAAQRVVEDVVGSRNVDLTSVTTKQAHAIIDRLLDEKANLAAAKATYDGSFGVTPSAEPAAVDPTPTMVPGSTTDVIIEQKADGTFKVMEVPAGVTLVVNKVGPHGETVSTLRTEGPHRRAA